MVIAVHTRPTAVGSVHIGIVHQMCRGADHQIVCCRGSDANLIIIVVRSIRGTIHQAHPAAVLHQLDLVSYQVAVLVIFRRRQVLDYQNAFRGGAHQLVLHMRSGRSQRIVHTECRDKRQVVVRCVRQGSEGG